ncbi:MAG: hypothetical protein NZM18_05565 [Thermoflexales bacterium]|nr:hypothetical protein [Thermoflexales bacterium]
MSDQTFLKLRELLLNEFSEPELIALCKDIGLDYEALPGMGAFGKTREIIEAARAQDKLRLLQSRLRELKPEAYAISVGTEMSAAEASVARPGSSRQAEKTGSPITRAIPTLLVLMILVLGASLIFSRLSSDSTLRSTPQVTATTPPTSVPMLSSPTDLPEVVGQPAFQTAETPTPDFGPTEALADAITATAVPALPMSEPTPTATDAASVGDSHPAVINIRQINDQLTLFYTGQASAKDLEYFWMGEALRMVVDFGNTRLPRAMRIPPSRRDALEITHEYLQGPTVISETTTSAVVASRESWRYANTLTRNEFCEVRDYIYNMTRDGERYRVRSVQSRLVRSGCVD